MSTSPATIAGMMYMRGRWSSLATAGESSRRGEDSSPSVRREAPPLRDSFRSVWPGTDCMFELDAASATAPLSAEHSREYSS